MPLPPNPNIVVNDYLTDSNQWFLLNDQGVVQQLINNDTRTIAAYPLYVYNGGTVASTPNYLLDPNINTVGCGSAYPVWSTTTVAGTFPVETSKKKEPLSFNDKLKERIK